MNKLFFSFLFLLYSIASLGQKGNFGILTYTIPAGYQLVKADNLLTYFRQDDKTGAYCKFVIYQTLPDRGGPQQNFDFFWDNMLKKAFNVTGPANMQPAGILKGWQLLMGTAIYADNGVNTMAILTSFSGKNIMQNVCILSNADIYKADIESFIASVDVSEEITTAAPSTSPATKPASPATPTASTNVKYEVWMCHCFTPGSLSSTAFKTVVLSPDGKCLYYLPEKGLNGITPANSNESGSWGSVTDKGKMLQLRNERYGNMELYKISATAMSRYADLKSSIYKKVKQVDGLRFEGAYSPELSYYNGKTDVISRQIDPNKRPIIFFKKDGTYINEGIEFSNLTFGDPYALGKGTYEVVNYSLILTTQSGRKLQVAFTPVLDANPAASNNSGLIINNNLFYRLGKDFVPNN